MHDFFKGRESPVVARPPEEFWWHSTPLPDGTRTRSRQEHQDTQFLMWDAIAAAAPDGLAGKRVLDVGAADGFFSIAAAAAGAAEVHAVDAAYIGWPDHIRLLSQAWNLPVRIVSGDFRTHAFAETYDLILFLGVLYHLPDVFDAIKRLRGLLNPGGAIIIETQMSALDIGRPVLEMASDVFATTAGQGVEALDNVGVSNFLFPNDMAMQQLAHMYRFRCRPKVACDYSRRFTSRAFYVFETLDDGAPRWTPPT